jgi:nucleotide-binding universal stress UspA family protein
MVKEGPIVVGVDGSPESRAALRVAAEEARIHRRKVRAVMVHGFLDGYMVAGIPAFEPSHVEEARAALARIVVEELGDRPGVEVDRVVTCDLPARGLLAEARGASLIVVGARGLGGFRSLLVGSVSQQVVQHAPCPVLIVRDALAA